MAQPAFSEDDRINPVHCPRCRAHIPRLVAEAQTYCDRCLADLAAGKSAKPIEAVDDSVTILDPDEIETQPLRNPVSGAFWVALTAVIVVALFAAYMFGTNAGTNRQDQLDDLRIKLQSENPDLKFAQYFGGNQTIIFNYPFDSFRVSTVALQPLAQGIKTTVRLTSVADVAVAPQVTLVFYNDQGKPIAEGTVVHHQVADLMPGDTVIDADLVKVPVGAVPVIVSVRGSAPETVSVAAASPVPAETTRASADDIGPEPQVDSNGVVPAVLDWIIQNTPDAASAIIPLQAGPVTRTRQGWTQRIQYHYRSKGGEDIQDQKEVLIQAGKVIGTSSSPGG